MAALMQLVKSFRFKKLRIGCWLLAILLAALGVRWLYKDAQRLNRAHELAVKAVAVAEENPELSSQLALRAANLDESEETIAALRRSLQTSPTIKLSGSKYIISSAFFSPDSKWLLVSCDGVRLWDRSSGQLVSQFEVALGVYDRDSSVSFSPDSKRLLTVERSGVTKLWELPAGRLIAELQWVSADKESNTSLRDATFSSDGRRVFGVGYGSGIMTWDSQSGCLLSQLKTLPYITSAVFSPNGEWVVTDGPRNNGGQLWEVSTGRQVAELPRFVSGGYGGKSAVFNLNGEWLAFYCHDYKSRILEVSTGRQIIEMKRGLSLDVEFSPDGKLFATRAGGFAPWDPQSIIIRELPTGREINKFDRHPSRVNSLAFSPDSKFVASASGASTSMAGNQLAYDSYKAGWATLVWEANSGRQIARIENQSKLVKHVAFSPDGKWLVTADEGGVAVIHPYESFAPPETILALARQRGLRKFTEAERGKYGVE